MMNEGKLNINAPLMSVRRSSAKPPPSSTEPKRKILKNQQAMPMTLDQVTEPVTVPFNWEHIPGRSKGNNAGSKPQPPREPSITPTPCFPPGKSTNVSKQPLQKEPKFKNKFRSSSISNTSIKIDCDKDKKDEKFKKLEENGDGDDDDDDEDDYSDAVETLSPTESFSMNCSASGVSGLDNLDANKSRASSTDKQAQDFMMSRFLPAAKAMALHLQPPQHAPRKQSVLVEQPRDVTKLVGVEKKAFVNSNVTDIIPYTGQFQEEEEEEEESDDESDDHANISAKGCGLFPSSCVKNSLCLLNAVPVTKMGNQFPMCSANEVGRPNRSSHFLTYRSAPTIKKAWDSIHKSKSSTGAASPDMQEARKKWTSESNRYYNSYSGELKQLGRLSPFRRSRAPAAAATAAGVSPFRSKPQSLFPGATRLLGDSKQAEKNNQFGKLKFPSRGHASIQEVLSQGAKRSSNSGNLSMEKTLYIDTVSTVKSPCSNISSSLGNSQRVDTMVGKERNSIVVVDSFQDMKHQQSLEENLDSEVLSSTDANSTTLSSMLDLMAKEDKDERLATDQEINREPMSLQLVQSSLDKDTKINNQQIVVVDESRKAIAKCVMYPLPPPLPKSPSESWLCHALPLVSLKNSSPHWSTQSHSKRQGLSRASSYSKWETIVKTSNLHHDHECCSRELTIYKSQHSKS